MRLCERAVRVAPVFVLLIISFAVPSGFAQAPQTSSKPAAKYPQLPSEVPAQFNQVTSSFNYDQRDVMMPMRDGVKLHADIVIPKALR